jgi:hypothetical protein
MGTFDFVVFSASFANCRLKETASTERLVMRQNLPDSDSDQEASRPLSHADFDAEHVRSLLETEKKEHRRWLHRGNSQFFQRASRDVPAAEGDLFFPRLVGVKPGCNPSNKWTGLVLIGQFATIIVWSRIINSF